MLPILLAALAAQTPYSSAPASSAQANEVYEAPVVRPYEPSSALEAAEGDGAAGVQRAPIDAPVTVDRYRRSYEVSPSDGEIAYEQGVAQAELNADALSGPMDGRWQVRDGTGRVLLDLVLNDRGGGRAVEGAWMTPDGGGRTASGLIGPVVEDGGRAALTLEGEGRLVLDARLAGAFEHNGRSERVTLVRPG